MKVVRITTVVTVITIALASPAIILETKRFGLQKQDACMYEIT